MLQNYFEIAVLLATAYRVINGGVNMASRVTPYQVTFGEDGRPCMIDFVKKKACGHDTEITVEEIQRTSDAAFKEEPATTVGQGDGYAIDTEITVEEIQHTSEAGFKEEPATTVGQGDGYSLAPTTAVYDDSQSPCTTYLTNSIDVRSFPVRLDFTLKNPDDSLIELRFTNGRKYIYVVKFGRGDGLRIEDSFAPLDIQFDESHRFWMTYENGEVKVGLHGNDDPLLHYIDPAFTTNEVDGILLYTRVSSTRTEWKIC